MTNEQANKIIAEYMGYGIDAVNILGVIAFEINTHCGETVMPFSKSLDALVPVWLKMRPSLGRLPVEIDMYEGVVDVIVHGFTANTSESKVPQEAAAHATAKAILELECHAKDQS